ncbi:QacE family quaternary ammonium compound efflux SMR transporter [Mycobacterium sp. Y57]|uniref:DMT family transporter n=1 Tax=Mycolicibacterium xanthum TaxID=2796469 RepID=UPI001C862F25|nr:SMR family transporter [Mycolicibacterium xanthum]MBX7434000.1 QacE family quaternary ammonium compound efflux SMR transporter [Mycolicibacterium xanthum]
MQYLFLVLAIGSEVVATLSLRVAAHGRPKLYLPVAIGYVFAFAMLTATLREGMPLGVAYGIWAAAGVAITAIASHRLFHEALTRRMLGGIALIAVGVLLLELGAGH